MRPTLYECPENFQESMIMHTANFPKFLMGAFLPIDAKNMRTKFEVRSFT